MSSGPRAVEVAGRAAFPGFRLRVVERTPSTQDVVRAAARAGAAAGFCCVAMEQSAGRGRQGRVWAAAPGSALLVSLLVRVGTDVAGGVPLVGGLAVCDAVERLGVATDVVGVKWPNDVLVDGHGKLAGVLAEVEPAAAHGAGEDGLAVALGVGLNLAAQEFPPGVEAAALDGLVSRAVPWEEALAELLTALGTRLAQLALGGIPATAAAWRSRAVGLGRPIEARTPAGVLHGTAVDIADDGALLVDTGAPTLTRLVAGDVHLVPPPAAEAGPS
jgi:BirA family transcriptional regulator, biotin operon repressor / biotin---[acetyl-CoA-carboxylase] ligase